MEKTHKTASAAKAKITAGGHQRGPYAGTPKRRREIIAAAFAAFAREGFRGSSLQEISDAVGISKAGLLHHMGSKEMLLQAVLEFRDEANVPPADTRGLDMLTHLRRAAETDNATQGAVALFVVMSAEATNPAHPAHDFFVRRYDRLVNSITAALDEARVDGDLKQSLNSTEAARHIVSVMDGLQLQMLLNPEVDRLAAFDSFIRQFLALHAARNYEELVRHVFERPTGRSRDVDCEAVNSGS